MIPLLISVILISLKIWLKATLQIWRTSKTQDHDKKLMQSTIKYSEWYSHKTINNVENFLGHTKPGDNPANWKIALPEDLLKPTIQWYHQVTGHPGSKRHQGQLQQRYYHRDLRQMVDNLNCDFCQRTKLDGKAYGFLPEHEVQSIPFVEYTVDLIGPQKIQEKIFKLYYRSVTSEMCAIQQKIPKIWLMPKMRTI